MNNTQIKPEAAPDDRATAVKRIADSLDLAVLKPTATAAEVRAACEMVNRYGIKSVCVPTSIVSFATLYTDQVCAVVGFPHGNTTPFTKTVEAVEAMGSGAKEIDVVVNYGRLLDGDPGPIRPSTDPHCRRGPPARGDRQSDPGDLLLHADPDQGCLPPVRLIAAWSTSRPRPASRRTEQPRTRCRSCSTR